MLSCFPEFRREELFYSAVARYIERMRFENGPMLQKLMFGKPWTALNTEMPRGLGVFVKQLPNSSNISVDSIIDCHTLAPLYLPFVSSDLRAASRQAMYDNEGQNAQSIMGMNGKIRSPQCLRYCPVCWEQDQRSCQEPIWRCSHQAPGVEVCTKHLVFLEASEITRSSRYGMHTARAALKTVRPREIDVSDQDHRAMLEIAQDVVWLLENARAHPPLELLRRRYIELMHEKGLAKSGRRIVHASLIDAIKHRFSARILENLGCPINENGKCYWAMRLVRQKIETMQHPLLHLILIRSLGLTAQSFFSSLGKHPASFGRGPWPCYNHICPKYGRRTIDNYKIYWKNKEGKLTGSFRCPECGYSYYGRGMVGSTRNPFQISRCHERGELWINRLEELWRDQSKSLYQIEEALKCSKRTLINFAIKEKLPLRSGKDEHRIRGIAESISTRLQTRLKKTGYKRALWLDLLQAHPDASTKQLENLEKHLYTWLMKWDRAWLTVNRPAPRRRGRVLGHKHVLEDWAARDHEYSILIKQSAAKIKSQPGCPVWISTAAIKRDTSIACMATFALQLATDESPPISPPRPFRLDRNDDEWMSKHLPMTQSSLRECVESLADFARRRLIWAINECQVKSIRLTKNQLIRLAGVHNILRGKISDFEKKGLHLLVDSAH